MICDDLDSGNLACGIFVDLRKAFDTVYHQILLKNLNMELLGANDWFNSSLTSTICFNKWL